MRSKYVFITDPAWFESTSLKNPIIIEDHKLDQYFQDLYSMHYDTRLLAAKAPTKEEKQWSFYNDYRERFGTPDIKSLDTAIIKGGGKRVFLNGFNQEQFIQIAPKLEKTAEVIYFFKCPQIKDISALSRFTKLKAVHIYWNNMLKSLWDMTENKQLKVFSGIMMSKLSNIEMLKASSVEYVCLDSRDNNGHKKKAQFDGSVFEQVNSLKHLSMIYSNYDIDY